MSDGFEDVLVAALDAHERDGVPGVRRVLADHPAIADRLRVHLGRLLGLGMLDRDTTPRPGGAAAESFPERLGEFRLLRKLGGGGMGVVFLAEQGSLGRRVALKIVRSEHLFLGGAIERFRREVEAVAKLQHPAIVPVFAAGEDDGVPWLAMEHVDGVSLDRLIDGLAGRDPAKLTGADLRAELLRRLGDAAAARGATPPPDDDPSTPFAGGWERCCTRIVRAIATALQHAHERGVLHRDVKPSNVMLTRDGRVQLLDFGLALAEGSARLTGTGAMIGSPAYMAPEQLRGDVRRIDARTDVYALGVTWYELLTLRMPYQGDNAAMVREQALAGQPAPMRLLHRGLSRDAETVCRKAMDVEPARRYPSAAALAADLDNLLALRPVAARPPGAWLVARRWAQRNPARATAAVAAVLLFGVAPTAFLLQQQAANREIVRLYDVAREQRDRAREAVATMLVRVANESLFEMPRMLPVRRDLLASARAFYERFLAEAKDDPDLLGEAADAAMRLAKLDADLGQSSQALAAAERARELGDALARTRPADAAPLRLHARMVQGSAQQALARLPEALDTLTEAATLCEAGLLARPDDAELHADAVALARVRGFLLRQLQRFDEAKAAFDELAMRWPEAERRTRGTPSHVLAVDHMLCALADEAEMSFQRRDAAGVDAALARRDAVLAGAAGFAKPLSTRLTDANVEALRARLAGVRGDDAAKEAALRRATQLVRDTLGDFPDHANALRLLAAMLNELAVAIAADEDRAADAAPLFDEAIAVLRRLIANDPGVTENRVNLAASLANVGSRRLDDGKAAAAVALFTEAEQLARAAVAEAPTRTGWSTVLYNATWFLGQAQGEAGDHDGQAAAAERLAALRPADGKTQRIAAGLVARSLAGLAADAAVAADARSAARARREELGMRWLAEAARLGCGDVDWIETGPEFEPLRTLPGFDAVLRQFQANARQASGGR